MVTTGGVSVVQALAVIFGRELRTRLRDGTAVLVAFVAPVVLATLFSVALGTSGTTSTVRIGVVDADGGPFAASVTDEVLGGEQLRDVVVVTRYADEPAGRSALASEDVGALIVFLPGFSAEVGAGDGGAVEVVRSPGGEVAGVVAQSAVRAFSSLVEARTISVRAAQAAGVAADDLQRYVEANGEAGPALSLSGSPTGALVGAASYYGPAMAVLFVFFVLGSSSRSLLTERRLGTLARMQVAPIPPWAAVAGKGSVAMVLALASMLVGWCFSTLVFGAHWGAPVPVLALCSAHVLAVGGITLLVASRARTDTQVDGAVMIVAFVCAILGGSLVTLYSLPDLLQRLALLTPNGWAMDGFTTLALGGDLRSVLPSLAALSAIALLTGGVGVRRIRGGLR